MMTNLQANGLVRGAAFLSVAALLSWACTSPGAGSSGSSGGSGASGMSSTASSSGAPGSGTSSASLGSGMSASASGMSSGQNQSGAASSSGPRLACLPDQGVPASSGGGFRACADPNFPPHGTPETALPITLVNDQATLDSVVICDHATEYFQVTVPAHRGLRVDWAVPSGSSVYVMILQTNGLVWSTHGSRTAEISNPGVAQRFLVRVENGGTLKQDLTLNFSIIPVFCRPDSLDNSTQATAASLDIYGAQVHSHCAGVPDYFSFVASLDGEARITLEHDASLEPLGFSVFVMGDETSPVTTSAPAPIGATAAFAVVPGTTYVIKVADAPGATVAGRPFRVTVEGDTRCSPDDGEPDDTPPRARLVFAPDSGALCGSNPDHWWFRAPATGLVNYHVQPSEPGTPLDVAAMLPDGAPIPFTVTPQHGGVDLSFNVTLGTVYVIRVQNVPGQLNNAYSISENGPVYCREEESEPNDSIATAGAVDPLGGRGCSCNGNPDYFSLLPVNSGDAWVRVCRFFVADLLDVEILDEGGSAVPTTDVDAGCGPLFGFSAVAGSRYAARVSKRLGGSTDCYTIDLDGHAFCDDDVFEPNDTHQTATPFTTAPLRACGNNPDYITFDVPVAGRANLLVEAQFLVTPLVTVIEDASGAAVDATRVPYSFGSSNRFELQWEAAAGPHAVRVTGPWDGSLFYALRLVPPVDNDLCINAIQIPPGGNVSGTTAGARNDVQFNGPTCTGFPTVGPDVFYRVTVPSGAQLDARLSASGGDLSLALLDSCQNNCCWAGSDRAGPVEDLSYINATAQDQELILVVDGYSPYPNSFSLRTTVTP